MDLVSTIAQTTAPATPMLPRAKGDARLAVRRRGARTVLDRLYQRGSAKVLLPKVFTPDLTAVLLNTAGGLTGGDRFSVSVTAAPDTHLTVTSQTAERAYRAIPGNVAKVTNRITAAEGAKLHWLPQETIFFDGAALTRRLEVDLAEDAAFLAVEPGILGRTAMGETVHRLHLNDSWRVRRNGRLVFADAMRLMGDPSRATSGRAALGGHLAFATILYAASDADHHVADLAATLDGIGAASLIRNGVLVARMTAPDGFALRRKLVPTLERLTGASLPKTWSI